MSSSPLSDAILSVLEIARWAPSGDNAQPWSFRIKSANEVEVLVRRSDPNIYEYRNGESTLISAGALLENIQIAAPAFGLRCSWNYVDSVEGIDRIVLEFSAADRISRPEVLAEIVQRSVDRRPYKTQPLTAGQKQNLEAALNPNMEVQWYESVADRWAMASLSALATAIRLSIPETFEIHRSIVDWKNGESERAIPSRALGLDPLTLTLTRWSMANWKRTKLMNAGGAPKAASLQMDYMPGICSAAYFAIRMKRRSVDARGWIIETLEAGQAVQRLWLQATRLGLAMQPCVAILAFWSYAASNKMFTVDTKARHRAGLLAERGAARLGSLDDLVFLARIGTPRKKSTSRSIRRPLSELLAS